MFKGRKKGASPLDPEFLRGFHERAKTEGPRIDALIDRISESAQELGRLAILAADKGKSEDERHEALVLISGAISRNKADISAIEGMLLPLTGDGSDLLANLASSVLAAHYLERMEHPKLLKLASDSRSAVRLGAVSEAEMFVLARGYDPRIGSVFAAHALDADPLVRKSCRSGLFEGEKSGDEWAGKLLDAVTEREKKGRLDS
ncbi:MAG TPA: hypothetical protein VLD37_07020 [Candidatus Bilamarchaeum sp.]|nr:hypothetical protein [Candidatus Bilamarchaeum sp.]